MSDTFDADAFLDWLDEQEGPIPKPVMAEQCFHSSCDEECRCGSQSENQMPNFPWDYVVGVTGTFVDEDGETITDLEKHDGEIYFGYYKRDLRRAAKRKMPID